MVNVCECVMDFVFERLYAVDILYISAVNMRLQQWYLCLRIFLMLFKMAVSITLLVWVTHSMIFLLFVADYFLYGWLQLCPLQGYHLQFPLAVCVCTFKINPWLTLLVNFYGTDPLCQDKFKIFVKRTWVQANVCWIMLTSLWAVPKGHTQSLPHGFF